MDKPTRSGLVRGIGRWDLVAVALNGIIGAGIFGLPARVYGLIGTYSLLAFFVCGIVVSLIILCFAEVGSRYRDTGGPYLYAREAFGNALGFQVGWLMWLARLTAFAANCNLLVQYLAFFWPSAGSGLIRAGIITLVVASLTTINLLGVRDAAIASNVFTIAKLIPLLLFVATGLFFVQPAGFSLEVAPGYSEFSTSVLLLIYAFTGFEMAVIPTGEVRDPGRNMPRAILISIAVVIVLYMLIQTVYIGVAPGLTESDRPLAEASTLFLGSTGATIISVGALVSIGGNLNVILLVASRLPFAMAREGELPSVLSRTHPRFFTPHVSILATAAIILILTVSSAFVYAATVSVIARLLAYAGTCAALPVLRGKKDAPPPLFTTPGGVVVAFMSLALSVWLLSNIEMSGARDAAIAMAVGTLIYFANRYFRQRLLRKPAPGQSTP